MPCSCDPSVNYRRLAELANEFKSRWTALQAFYIDAAVGFGMIKQSVEDQQNQDRSFVRGTDMDSEAAQDSRIFSHDCIFSGDFCTSAIHKATQGDAKSRNAANGSNFALLGQLCLVSFYDYWNEYLRREYVIAKGFLALGSDGATAQAAMRQHAKFALWGDIRYYRQAVVHNGAKADSDFSKCEVLRWFKPGQTICLTPQHVRQLFLALLLFHNQLFDEQFPTHRLQVPPQSGARP